MIEPLAALSNIPAIAQMAEHGPRFVCWRNETRNGRETKVPLRISGHLADSTKCATWSTLDECREAVPRLKASGVGFVLAAERDAEVGRPPIVGIDLDGYRNLVTDKIKRWAELIIRKFNSYTEISPSGTGVKIFIFVDRVPALVANKYVIEPANGTGKAQQIEIFTTARYFALTEEHLDGTPDEICDATEAFEQLAAEIAKGRKAAGTDGAEPAADTMQLIEQNPRLAKLWRGEKDEGDTTASGLDWSLARALGRAGVTREEIARVLSHYPHGQIGGGKKKGGPAKRRLGPILLT